MTLECVNNGGAASIIRLPQVPRLEQELILGPEGVRALECWQGRPGEILTVMDPESACYRARVTGIDVDRATLVPFSRLPAMESRVEIEVFQALPDKERFELVLQKLTELGVSRIVPLTSRRSSTQQERDAGQKKSHRWPEVVLRAAKQCRRAMIPELYPVMEWDQALYLASHADSRLMLFEGEAPWSLREGLGGTRPDRVALLVGPEGGFDPAEVEDARQTGFLPVSLGPRILRTETAAIVGASLLQFAIGDLG